MRKPTNPDPVQPEDEDNDLLRDPDFAVYKESASAPCRGATDKDASGGSGVPTASAPSPARAPTPRTDDASAPDECADQQSAQPQGQCEPKKAVTRDEFRELVRRANQGNQKAIVDLRRLLDENPDIWKSVGDLLVLAEKAWTSLISEDNWLAAESIQRHVTELKAELAGTHPTRLEKLLVDQVGVTYLAATYGESRAATPASSTALGILRLRQAESGQKRLLNAVRTLTMLRAAAPRGLAPIDALKIFGPEQKRA